jgi:hypothetical protein
MNPPCRRRPDTVITYLPQAHRLRSGQDQTVGSVTRQTGIPGDTFPGDRLAANNIPEDERSVEFAAIFLFHHDVVAKVSTKYTPEGVLLLQ